LSTPLLRNNILCQLGNQRIIRDTRSHDRITHQNLASVMKTLLPIAIIYYAINSSSCHAFSPSPRSSFLSHRAYTPCKDPTTISGNLSIGQCSDRISRLALGSSKNSDDANFFDQAFKTKIQMPWDTPPSPEASPKKERSISQQTNDSNKSKGNDNWPWMWSDSESSSNSSAKEDSGNRLSDESRPMRKPRKPRQPKYPSVLASSPFPSDSDNDDENWRTVNTMKSATRAKKNLGKDRHCDRPSTATAATAHPSRRKPNQNPTLGILLIDHGSKRQASNDHLHSLANMYQNALNDNDDDDEIPKDGVAVRAAHMEIATPSILTSLREMLKENRSIERVLCVPYFLSPGKHATTDVPNLIKEAIKILDEEGLLDMDNGEGSKVEILTTKSLGSRLESMLGAVNDLVGWTLNMDVGLESSEKRFSIALGSSISGDAVREDIKQRVHEEQATEIEKLREELVKYTNRYKLLEKALEAKVRELKTVSNRAKLLEDAVARVQNKVKKQKDDSLDQFRLFKQESERKILNLTNVVNMLMDEKVDLESEAKALVTQQIQLEREYNTTIGGLRNRVNSLETAIEDLLRGQDERDFRYTEIKDSKAKMEETVDKQKESIEELQDQLATLLDAYSELEQVNNESEELIKKYEIQVKEAKKDYETALKSEQDTKQQYELQLSESKQRLEKESETFREVLEASKQEFERSLEEEKEKVPELKMEIASLKKLQASTSLLPSPSVSANETSWSVEDWNNLELELEQAKSAAAEYKTKLGDVEAQLRKQQEAAKAQKNEQHENMKILQGQLLSFNQTIQKQHYQIEKYQEQVNFLKKEHEESILIAKSSVEASQQRESQLLSSIEELENELVLVRTEKNESTTEHDESKALLQRKIDQEKLNSEKLTHKNRELELVISQLNDKIKVLTTENEDISVLERRDEGRKMEDSSETISDVSQGKEMQLKTERDPRKRTWRRVLFRPWTLLRKQ